MPYIEEAGIDRNLVLMFLLRFSRFEFALKVSGYADGDETQVVPAWCRFAEDIAAKFDMERNTELAAACRYYLDHPPRKQVLAAGCLAWSDVLPADRDRTVELLLGLVRRVRNNLFHGGKYAAMRHDETARDTRLLSGGLLILDECLNVAPRIRQAYDGTTS